MTFLLVALSFNYPQAVKNIHWLGKETVCVVRHFHPVQEEMNPDSTYALASPQPVTDEDAACALAEFFREVLATDGPAELRRIYAAFYMQCHGTQPPADWSDRSGDGELRVKPPAMAAGSGR